MGRVQEVALHNVDPKARQEVYQLQNAPQRGQKHRRNEPDADMDLTEAFESHDEPSISRFAARLISGSGHRPGVTDRDGARRNPTHAARVHAMRKGETVTNLCVK